MQSGPTGRHDVGPVGPTGPQGPQGETGPQGPAGASGSTALISKYFFGAPHITQEPFHSAGDTGYVESLAPPVAGQIGMVRLCAGSADFGTISLQTGNTIAFGSRAWIAIGHTVSVLQVSDAAAVIHCRFGFEDARRGSDITNGVYFRYTHGESAGQWVAVTEAANVQTATATGVVMTVNQFYKFEIRVNAAATEAVFLIDGVIVATHTTNLPTGIGQAVALSAGNIDKAGAGSVLRYMWVGLTELF